MFKEVFALPYLDESDVDVKDFLHGRIIPFVYEEVVPKMHAI